MLFRRIARDRQDVAGSVFESFVGKARKACAFLCIVKPCIATVDVGGQTPLAPLVVKRVLKGREHRLGRQPKLASESFEKLACALRARAVVDGLIGHQRLIAPDGLAVAAPEGVQRPARQLLARIPFTLPKMDKARRGVALTQLLIKICLL